MEFFWKFMIGIAFIFCLVLLLKHIGKWNPPVSTSDNNGMPHKHGAGIGGWLLFLVFSLAFTSPLFSVGYLLLMFANVEPKTPQIVNSSLWIGAKGILWFFTAVSVAVSIYSAKELLIKRNKEVVGKVIKLIWISGPGIAVLATLAMLVYANIFMPEAVIRSSNFVSSLGEILKAAASATIWTLYLRMSRRVKNTYGC